MSGPASPDFDRSAVTANEQILLDIYPCAQERNDDCANDPAWATPSSASLSARERGILLLVTQGLSNKEIARRLCIGPETVKSHLKSVFWKLTVRTRAEAAYRALVLRLV